jgi:microcystin-dependent protein
VAEKDLSERERAFIGRISSNPLDFFQGETLGWLEDFIRITTVGGGPTRDGTGSTGIGPAYYVPGDTKIVGVDLTAQTGVYVYEDASGNWLYLNGAQVSQTTYADLYAFYGPNKWGTDTGGNFFLPDSRGRSLYFCGTHADTDLGDTDGITLADRRPKHQHVLSASLSAAGTSSDSAGTPAGSVSGTVASHNHGGGSVQGVNPTASTGGTGFTGGDRSDVVLSPSSQAPAWSGSFTGSAMSGHSHTVSGSVTGSAGSGMALDAPPYLFIGSLLVRF